MRLFKVTFFLTIILSVPACQRDYSLGVQTQLDPIAEKYKELTIIDIHNHDASGSKYKRNLKIYQEYGIDKVVLFGDISEPSAMKTDQIAFDAYKNNSDQFIPFIAGINLHDSLCISYIKTNFEKGCFGIGEIVAASTYSPVTSHLPWKGLHPLDGYFPDIYRICAEYHKPILLHIDPPNGYPVEKLKEAAGKYPDTNFIFGHANAFNPPTNLETLLKNYDNIYIDFFAGFTVYNPASTNTLADFVPLIKKYPERFMVSTDSGFDVGLENAYKAIYELFELLDYEIVAKIAGENFLDLLEMDSSQMTSFQNQ